MPNIIRIRNLEKEIDLSKIIIPVDKDSYLSNAKQVSIDDLKTYVLSGFTWTGGTSGTSGVSPCTVTESNIIMIVINYDCVLEGWIDCDTSVCDLDGYICDTCYINGYIDCNA